MRKRFTFIDWAKVIAITAVCVGHFLPGGTGFKILLYSFHVPVFFVISGFLSDVDNHIFSFDRIRKLMGRLLIPYAFWFWVSAAVSIDFQKETLLSTIHLFFFKDGFTLWNLPLWFLPCFFIVSVLHLILSTYVVKSRIHHHLIAAVLCIGVALVFDYMKVVAFPFGLNKCAFLLGVQFVGSACRMIYNKKEAIIIKNNLLGVFLLVLTGIATYIANFNNNISLLYLDYNNAMIYFPVSILMSISFLWSCTLLADNKLIKLFAANTLPLLCAHYFVLRSLGKLLSRTHSLYLSAGFWIAITFFLCLILLSKIVRKYPKMADALRIMGFQI